jgi:hypothetical protein
MPPRNRRKGKVGGSPRQPGPGGGGGGGGGVGGAQTHSRRDRNLRETPSPPPNPPAADPILTIPTSAAGEIDELDGFSFEHLLVGPHALYLRECPRHDPLSRGRARTHTHTHIHERSHGHVTN